ncbi:hypothetical protein EVAR_19695_1 [Eumeta japonica]|uniref:Uncharacterized protein n=1 Tax=Eumeta variegata TaxID=151549 RepID=A0A4C1V221_EUMVA|nr:hypothetical protein EVAR_19695_1 [Eumeta japonica]
MNQTITPVLYAQYLVSQDRPGKHSTIQLSVLSGRRSNEIIGKVRIVDWRLFNWCVSENSVIVGGCARGPVDVRRAVTRRPRRPRAHWPPPPSSGTLALGEHKKSD